MSKDKYGSPFSSHTEAVVVIILQIILLKITFCLQMSYCLLHLLFTFQCSPVGLYEQRNMFLFSVTTPKWPLILNMILKEDLL